MEAGVVLVITLHEEYQTADRLKEITLLELHSSVYKGLYLVSLFEWLAVVKD